MEIKQQQLTNCRGVKFEYYEDGERLGRATIYILHNELHDHSFGLLEDVFVEPQARGKGVGSKLTEEVIQHANRIGCYKLICTSRYIKPRVHELYEKLGFVDHGKEFRIDFARDRRYHD